MTRAIGWEEHTDTIHDSRVYIRPDKEPWLAHLLVNNTLDEDQIRKYPALLVQEPQSENPHPARVVYIDSVVKVGREYRVQYHAAPHIPPIPSEDIVELLGQCGLTRMDLNHSCWSVIDFDLFKLLLDYNLSHRMTPSVFNFDAYYRPDPNLVSVMMPFDAAFNPVYDAIKAGVARAGYECRRADDIWINQHIIQDVVDLIASSHIVICDLTGKNANVFYEAGIAHSLGKEIIMLTQSEADVPFDLRYLRYLSYLNNGEGLEQLQERIRRKLS